MLVDLELVAQVKKVNIQHLWIKENLLIQQE